MSAAATHIRTYGRLQERDRDEKPSLFFEPTSPDRSPAKSLLSRWTKSSTSWRDEISKLDAAPSSDSVDDDDDMRAAPVVPRPRLTDFSDQTEDDEEADEEDVLKQMERLRREARGETAIVEPAAPTKAHVQTVQTKRLGVSFSSSSLTALPTSDNRSSPQLPRSSPPLFTAIEEDTVPLHKAGAAQLGGRRQAVDSDSEDGDIGNRGRKVAPPSSQSSEEDAPLFPSGSPSARRSNLTKTRYSSPLEHNDSRPSAVDEFMSTLRDDEDEDEEVNHPVQQRTSSDPVFDFDDFDDDITPKAKGKKVKEKKIRPLGQKDMKALHSGMAASKRNRDVDLKKVQTSMLPMSDWLLDATQVVAAPIAESSPNAPLTDDIAAFTPSSNTRHPKHVPETTVHDPALAPSSSSPTARASKNVRRSVINGTSESHSEEDEESPELKMDAVMADAAAKEKQAAERAAREARIKSLQQQKAAALKAQRRQQIDDDDFEVLPDNVVRQPSLVPSIKTEAVRRGPDAKAINKVGQKTGPKPLSKNRQRLLLQAGKSTRPKEDATETLALFAGKTFDHAGLNRVNGGAKPAGQKEGRQNALTSLQLARMNLQSHNAQAASVRAKKEKEYGRARQLPEKKGQDLQALIQASVNHVSEDVESEEEEDDDYVPEGEEEVRAGTDEGEGDEIEYSGEEDQDNDNEDEEKVDEDDDATSGTDKENKPEDVEDEMEEAQIIRRKRRPSNKRVAVDSDDEESTPRAVRHPLVEVQAPSPTHKSTGGSGGGFNFGGELDLSGFGDATQGGGFSQLFEPTQVSGEPAHSDAFAGLRDNNVPLGLLAANAMLPSVNISDTQAARDNALIAGEVEMAMGSIPVHTQPKKQYLNDQGFFTQTKPATLPSYDRHVLGGPSDFTMSDPTQSSDALLPSSTEKGSSTHLGGTSSPTQGTPVFTRLKRRASPEPGAVEAVDDEEEGDEEFSAAPARKQRTAFDQMMANQRRRQEREVAKKSNLIDAQAEESDEDAGWERNVGSDDENEDEDDDGYVPELVDDAVVDEEEKKRQDELAAAKLREIEAEDDAKREAQARKIVAGDTRIKKRGQDFVSDGEDDEEGGGGKRRRWSKKERRKRRLEREDGLDKLEGEANAFKNLYEQDLVSETESEDESQDQRPESFVFDDSETMAAKPEKPAWLLVRERARKNAGTDLEAQDKLLDKEIGFVGEVLHSKEMINLDIEDEIEVVGQPSTMTTTRSTLMHVEIDEGESQFSIARSVRTSAASFRAEEQGLRRPLLTAQRSKDSFEQYVRDEALVNRRAAGAAGISVVQRASSTLALGSRKSASTGGGPARPRAPSRQSTSSSSSGGVLMPKGDKFA